MILAEKIVSLRKKAGWSQEELAEKLDVTRQSVSKWESAQSIPDINKILQMSTLFGVSTDYLLKEEQEEPEFILNEDSGSTRRRVSMEEANRFLRIKKKGASKIALGVFLCVISPVALLGLTGLSECTKFSISEDFASGLGVCILLTLVAVAVGIFISQGAKTKEFEFLEKEEIELEYGVAGMVKEEKKNWHEKYTKLNIIGTILCILSVVPIFGTCMFNPSSDLPYILAVDVLLILVATGCIAFINGGVYQGAIERLLEEGDYTRTRKKKSGIMSLVSTIYWCVVTAAYLLMILGPFHEYEYSWVIWPVAGVLYGAVAAVIGIINKTAESK